MREPLPAHERARILDVAARLLAERQEEAAQIVCSEAGKPLKAARVEAQRAVSTYTFSAVEARKLTGETVPMDASAAGEGKLALTLRLPIGIVGAISPFNFPLNLVAHKIAPALAAGCAVVLKPASATPLCRVLPRRARGGGGAAAGLDQRRLGRGWRDRRRADRGRAGAAAHLHGLGRRRLGPRRTRAPEARQARARQRHPGDRLCGRARRHRGEARGERVLLRGPELHLGAADLRRRERVGRIRRRVRAGGRGAARRRPRRRGDGRRAGDQRTGARTHPGVDRGVQRRGADGRRGDR